MRAHRADFEPFLPEGEGFEAYLDRMGRVGTWVEGQTEILAAACAWNVNIRVWGRDERHDKTIATPTPNASTRFVQMLHQYEQHYQLVEPLPESRPAARLREDDGGGDALSEFYKD